MDAFEGYQRWHKNNPDDKIRPETATHWLRRNVVLEDGVLKMSVIQPPTGMSGGGPEARLLDPPSGMPGSSNQKKKKEEVKLTPAELHIKGIIKRLEGVYQNQRGDVVRKDGFISTPLHVLKLLAEKYSVPFHSEVYIIKFPETPDKLYRVELLIGQSRGLGQAPNRKTAFQMAAIDTLEKMKAEDSEDNLDIPIYGLLPGWCTSRHIYRDLGNLCRYHDFEPAEFSWLEDLPYEGDIPMYGVKCVVEEIVTEGRSDDRALAKRLAGKSMFETLTGDVYPDDDVAIGGGCVGLADFQLFGITPSCSTIKRQWMEQNRKIGDEIFTPDDEPDDGDFGGIEDFLEAPDPNLKLPKKGEMTGITRVVRNDRATGFFVDTTKDNEGQSSANEGRSAKTEEQSTKTEGESTTNGGRPSKNDENCEMEMED